MVQSTLRAGRREWIGLAVLALPCMVYAMDLTVLNLAVPHLSADLRPSSAQLLWIVDIYGFVLAGSLVTMGTLGDRIGRRRLLLTGAGAFGAASVLAAFSTSPGMLIGARALLGLAGATLAPSTLSLIRSMFADPRQRTVAVGVWIASFSAGGAIGPLAGGVLLEWFWWGSVFLLAVPVMALLLVLGPVLLPEFRDPRAGRLDLPSAALSLAAVLAVIYGLKQLAQDGLGWPPVLAIVAGLGVGMAFVRRQQTLADPLLDLRLSRVPAFSAALTTNVVSFFVGFGALLFIAQYLQLVLGLALAAVGFGLLTQLDTGRGAGLAVLVAGSVVFSLALAPVDTLATDLAVGAVPARRAGAASAISETSAEVGGALGIAILGVIGTAAYRGRVADAVPAGVPAAASDAARDSLGGAVAAARQAFTQGLHLAFAISAAVAVGVAILAAVLLREVRAGNPPQ